MDLTMNSAAVPARASGRWPNLANKALGGLGVLTPVLDLAIRIWVGCVFFQSGMVKLSSWSSTLSLFEGEYAVPLLPPYLAAVLGTGMELIAPVFLVLGLGGRLAALGLFVFNIIAVISYPDLGEVGLKDHQYWGLMLLITLLHGPGKLSVDHFLRKKFLG
jgi:putative oxidoreductase